MIISNKYNEEVEKGYKKDILKYTLMGSTDKQCEKR